MTTTTVSRREAEDFLRLSRLAVIGASADRTKFANSVYRALGEREAGSVVAVHPSAEPIEGDRSYASVADVPGSIDGAIVMVSIPHAKAAVEQCLDAGIRSIWLFRGIGGPGATSDETVELCERRGATVIAGACPLMFLEHARGMHRLHRGIRTIRGGVAA